MVNEFILNNEKNSFILLGRKISIVTKDSRMEKQQSSND
jgi:hypothetical protein